MPTFTANDGVNLHYETWGVDTKPPLILVAAPHSSPSLQITYSNTSCTASQALEKSSSAMLMHSQRIFSSACLIYGDTVNRTSPRQAITSPV